MGFAGMTMLTGCGPATGTVSGEINVGGKPADRGVITFSPADSSGEAVTAEISNGKYQAKMVAGKKNVQISIPKVIGKRPESTAPNAAIVEITEERLPERYNSQTTLTFDVQPGSNTKNWEVESKQR
jgi:hypothetical protein